jgi:hypothetical protein
MEIQSETLPDAFRLSRSVIHRSGIEESAGRNWRKFSFSERRVDAIGGIWVFPHRERVDSYSIVMNDQHETRSPTLTLGGLFS